MTCDKLTEFDQSKHIVGGGTAQYGICYYICEYLENHKDSVWAKGKDFNEIKVKSTRCRTQTLVAAGKAKNVKKDPQAGGYNATAPLDDGYIYRVWLAVGLAAGVNHETMMITGDSQILLFDPNFGFYHVHSEGGGHVEKFESALTALYGTTPVGSFGYSKKRKAF